MLFLLLWVALAAIGWMTCFLYCKLNWDDVTLYVGATIATVGTLLLVCALIGLPISHTIDTQMLEDRPALVEKMQRTDLSAEEHAQLILDVQKFNEDLLHKQVFYPRNRLWFGWYHNEEVLMLQPIK